MSIQAMHYVFQASPAKAGARLVLLSLANHANDRLLSWPAVQTIARETRMYERSVQRALRTLQRDGEIEPLDSYSLGGRKATTYILTACGEWNRNVGASTAEKPYDNRTFNAGLPNENASHKPKNTPIPRHNATPAPTYGQGSHDGRSPQGRQPVGGPPAYRRDANTRIDTPAPASATEYPGVMPPEPNEPSLNHQNLRPPYPPRAGGNAFPAQAQTETVTVMGGRVIVEKPVRARLWTQSEAEALVGSMPDAYAEHFRRKGWNAYVANEG